MRQRWESQARAMVTGGNHAAQEVRCSCKEPQLAGDSRWPGKQLWGSHLPRGPTHVGARPGPLLRAAPGRNMASQVSPCKKRGRHQGFNISQGIFPIQGTANGCKGTRRRMMPLKGVIIIINQVSTLPLGIPAITAASCTSIPHRRSNHEEHTACHAVKILLGGVKSSPPVTWDFTVSNTNSVQRTLQGCVVLKKDRCFIGI